MISGRIGNQEARLELNVQGRDAARRSVEVVVDTGYNGHLTLPSRLVSSLELSFAGHRRATLADGSATLLKVYLATVSWHGRQREVLALQAAGTPLLGMALLRGSRLTMDVVEGGRVTVAELRDY